MLGEQSSWLPRKGGWRNAALSSLQEIYLGLLKGRSRSVSAMRSTIASKVCARALRETAVGRQRLVPEKAGVGRGVALGANLVRQGAGTVAPSG